MLFSLDDGQHTVPQRHREKSYLYESQWLHNPHCNGVNESVRGQLYIQELTG